MRGKYQGPADTGNTSRPKNEAGTEGTGAGRTNIRLEKHGNTLYTVTEQDNGDGLPPTISYTKGHELPSQPRWKVRALALALILISLATLLFVVFQDDNGPDVAESVAAVADPDAEWTEQEIDYINRVNFRMEALLAVLFRIKPEHDLLNEYPEALMNGAYDTSTYKLEMVGLGRAMQSIIYMRDVPSSFREYHNGLLTVVSNLEDYQANMYLVFERDLEPLEEANKKLMDANEALQKAQLDRPEEAE